MKFILAQIKVIATILLLGLFVVYLYFTFIFETSSPTLANTAANISLLFFVLMMLLCGLCAVIFEKIPLQPVAVAIPKTEDAAPKEEKEQSIAEIAANLPDNLIPLLEQSSATISAGKDALNAAISENKQILSSAVSENRESFSTALENMMSQLTALSSKNAAPLNLALENINARLDELESKIVSSHFKEIGISATAPATESFDTPETAVVDTYDYSEPEPEPTPSYTEAPLYDAGTTSAETATYGYNEPEPEPTPSYTEEPLYDAGTASAETETYSSEPVEEPKPELSETPLYDADKSKNTAEESYDSENIPPEDEEFLYGSKGRSGFEKELAELADLEILNDDANAKNDFTDVDINELLQDTENK